MPDALEGMAERVAAKALSSGRWYHVGPAQSGPHTGAEIVHAVLQALTPSDWAEGAVARGGMVAVSDSRCDEWFDAWPNGEYGDDRCHRRKGHKPSNKHWSPKRSPEKNPDAPLYRKADEGAEDG